MALASIHRRELRNALARHSDINLTMNVYSYVRMEEQEAAIAVLPAPPAIAGTRAKR
jgi:hypothetical protein